MSSDPALQYNPTNNTLINGKMPFNCSKAPAGSNCQPNAPYSKFRVQAGKRYKLRLINNGPGSKLGFSIDNHNLTIIANDFVPIKPYNVTFVQLGVSFHFDLLTMWYQAHSSLLP